MTRDPLDSGTSEMAAPVTIEPFGSEVPASLIVGTEEFAWAAAITRFKELAEGGAYARNSLRAHRADWKVWTTWCKKRRVRLLPATVKQIEVFCEDMIVSGGRIPKGKEHGNGAKRATIDRYLATLVLAHRAAGLANPLDSIEGKLVIRKIHRNKNLPKRQRKAHGLTWSRITEILAYLDPASAKDARDAALLCLGYDTFGRLSELIQYKWKDLSDEKYDDGSGRIFLERSKTDQEGKGKWYFVSPDTLAWLERWKSLAGLSDGLVFRSAPLSGTFDRALGERDVPRIFKRLALLAGLRGAADVSGHSLRVGKDQDAVAMGFSLAEIMEAGGWKSPAMPARYAEELEAERGASAKIAKRQNRTRPAFGDNVFENDRVGVERGE